VLLAFFSTQSVLAVGGGTDYSPSGTDGSPRGTDYSPRVEERPTGLNNPLREDVSSIPDLFNIILDIVMIFAIPIIVFFIIYAGFLYVTARGNVDTVQKAHRAILYSLLGAVIILGAKALMVIISGTVDSILK